MSSTRGNIIKYFTDIQTAVLAQIDEEVRRMTESQRREQLQRINMMKGEVGKMFDGLINQTNQMTFRPDGSIGGPVGMGMGSYGSRRSGYSPFSDKSIHEMSLQEIADTTGYVPDVKFEPCTWYRNPYDTFIAGKCKDIPYRDPETNVVKTASMRPSVKFTPKVMSTSLLTQQALDSSSGSYSSASMSPSGSSLTQSSIYSAADLSRTAPSAPSSDMSSMSSSSMMPLSGGSKKKTVKASTKSRKGPRNPVASAKRRTGK